MEGGGEEDRDETNTETNRWSFITPSTPRWRCSCDDVLLCVPRQAVALDMSQQAIAKWRTFTVPVTLDSVRPCTLWIWSEFGTLRYEFGPTLYAIFGPRLHTLWIWSDTLPSGSGPTRYTPDLVQHHALWIRPMLYTRDPRSTLYNLDLIPRYTLWIWSESMHSRHCPTLFTP